MVKIDSIKLSMVSRCFYDDLTFVSIRCSHGDVEEDKEIGWKKIHSDIFRCPPFSSWMSAVLGSGIQLLIM